ncbi:MAG TPA: hypothetical protein VMC03_06375 [Streptosporangiaceae bacterium]|nr:hypothetical protein [Streptosporangiaceae bacterium]
MFDYSTPSAGQRRPGRRRPPGRRPPRFGAGALVAVVAVVAAVAAAAVLIAGHAFTSGTAGAPQASATRSFESHAQPLHLGACIDPTLSIVQSFAPAIRQDLAAAVGGLAPRTGPPSTGGATAPLPAVSLLVRQVDTTSFSSSPGPYTANVAVPGVPGLTAARPGPSDPNYASDLNTWSQAATRITDDRKAAASAAASAGQAVAAMPLDQNPVSDSAISACVSALLVNVPPGGRHSYLLASDLEENEPAQLEGSFGGAPLVIVQTCDSGDVSTCQGLLQHFEALLHRLDVGPVTVIRPEDAGADIAQWIRTGEVTP